MCPWTTRPPFQTESLTESIVKPQQIPTCLRRSLSVGSLKSKAGISSLNRANTIWPLVAFPSSNTHTANNIPRDHFFLFNWPNLLNFGQESCHFFYLLDIVISGQKFTGHFQIFWFLEDLTGFNVPLWVPTYFSSVSSREISLFKDFNKDTIK